MGETDVLSALRAKLARRVDYLELTIAEIGCCSSKRAMDAILAKFYKGEADKKSAIAKAGQDLRHQKKLDQEREIKG